jgi:hypothetical protein
VPLQHTELRIHGGTFERLSCTSASSDVSNRFEFVSDVMSITFGNAGRRMIGDVRLIIVRTNVSLPTEPFLRRRVVINRRRVIPSRTGSPPCEVTFMTQTCATKTLLWNDCMLLLSGYGQHIDGSP